MVAARAPRSSQTLLERLVLSVFIDHSPRTRTEIETETGLSRAVVAGVIRHLLETGELTESAQPQVTGRRGRPSAGYQRLSLGAPVNLVQLAKGQLTRAARVHDAVATWAPAERCAPWSAEWTEWSGSVSDVFGELDATVPQPAAAADTIVAVPFPVTAGHGAPRLHLDRTVGGADDSAARRPRIVVPSWLHADPCPPLADLLGCPARLINDANLAALGEAGAADSKERSTLYVLVRDGVGAGLVIDGKIVDGAHGMTGELAHVQVVEDGPFCPCGNRGCLATQTRDPRVIEVLSAQYAHPMTWPDVEELVHRRDVVAMRVLRDLGRLVGRALAAPVTALDLDSIVLDAGLGVAAEPVIDGLQLELHHRCPPTVAHGVDLRLGTLAEPLVHGAWTAALQRRREIVR